MCESNTPRKSLTPPTGFEVRARHRPKSASIAAIKFIKKSALPQLFFAEVSITRENVTLIVLRKCHPLPVCVLLYIAGLILNPPRQGWSEAGLCGDTTPAFFFTPTSIAFCALNTFFIRTGMPFCMT